MAAVEQPLPVVNAPEIIDVDLLDDDDIHRLQRPSQRRRLSPPNSILVFDSDEEGHAAGDFRQAWNRARDRMQRRLARSRRVFSPPPPPQDNTIPPVPPLPDPNRMYRRAPYYPRGAVRPIQHPFEFEANIAAPTNQRDLQPAPRSHHEPNMGFGGAMLAEHTRSADGGSSAVGILQQSINYISTAFQRITGIPHTPPQSHPSRHGSEEILAFLAEAGGLEFRGARTWRDRRRDDRRRDEIEYKPSYTHPTRPAAGYTFDFALDEDHAMDTAPSSKATSSNESALETTLVCARCRDPLVLGGAGAGAGVEGRLWGLRCGHLLDGKCVAEIMKPPTVVVEESDEKPIRRSKGKGKWKATASPDGQVSSNDSEGNSIRSRLRPRASLASPFSLPVPSVLPLKRKASSTTTVKDRYEWLCPVAACGKLHTSLLYHDDGQEWVMDSATGAVGIFV